MRQTFQLFFIAVLLLPVSSFAAPQETFQVGKDYEVISQTQKIDSSEVSNDNKVTVVEFFNYGCGACNYLDPVLESWIKVKPRTVNFQRIPVSFNKSWDIYAKAYYIAKALNVSNELTPKIFDAIHDQKQATKTNALRTAKDMETFFVEHGVKPQAFTNALLYSPSIDAQLKQGKQLMQRYQIYSIPTIVINGKYKTNLQFSKGDREKLIRIIQFLIKQSQPTKS